MKSGIGSIPQKSAQSWALFAKFLRREITVRYLGSVTGLAWALLSPLALLAVYNFVFTTIFTARASGGGSFILFLAVGLWPWLATQEAIQRGAVCLPGYAGLIRKVAFPHEIAVYATVAATLVLQAAGYLAVLLVLKALGEPVHLRGLVVAVPVLAVMALAVAGITLALAALQVFLHDVEHVLQPALMLCMFLAPILYPITAVPEAMRTFIHLNPFTWVVVRLREALIDGHLALRPTDALALLVAVLLFLGGRWLFLRLSPYFEDFV